MKRLQVLIYSLIGLFFLVCSSCQKANEVFPKVEIKYPLSGENYDFRDTVLVGVDVSQSDGRISINLMDGSRVIPVPNHLVYQEGSVREYELYFTDRYLESGKYEIRVLAFNGENRASDFSEFRYTELPRRNRGFLALSGNTTSPKTITLDSAGIQQQFTIIGDYPYLTFNPFQQTIVTAPKVNGQLMGFDVNGLSKIFDVPNPSNPGLMQYEFVFSNDKLIYALENNGRIRAYNADGTIAISSNVSAGYIPQKGKIAEPGFLVSAQEDGKSSFKLFLLNPQNGAVLKQAAVPGKVISIGYAGNNIFVVAYPNNGDAVIATYNTVTNKLTEYGRTSGVKPLSLLRISDNEFLISTQDRILRFNPHLPQIPFVLHSFAATDMEYNDLDDEIYFASDKSVLVSIKGQSPYIAMVANDSIRQIELVYNK